MPYINDIISLNTYLKNRICILYAGVASQQLYERRDTDKLINEWANDDNSKITELMFILRGITYKEKEIRINLEIEHKSHLIDECWNKTKKLIDKNSRIIENMVSNYENEIILSKKNILNYKTLNEVYNKSLERNI